MKILVIEDDKETREFLEESLKEEGHSIDSASDGVKGLFLTKVNPYSCIILDQRLPKKDGIAVCTELRAKGNTTPIIMLSVVGDIDTKVLALQAGADDYLTKPYSYAELIARIQTVTRRPHVVEEACIQAGGIELFPESKIVQRNKKQIYLTRKEYAVFEYLMRHKGKIISRSTIMEQVWNSDTDPFSNTIEVHILNIRKKIETKDKKVIISVPGRGYQILDN